MQPFENYFNDYLSAIREARSRGASHDYLRSVFIDFARKSFNVDPIDVELEKGIKGATLRGSIDVLYQGIPFGKWKIMEVLGGTATDNRRAGL